MDTLKDKSSSLQDPQRCLHVESVHKYLFISKQPIPGELQGHGKGGTADLDIMCVCPGVQARQENTEQTLFGNGAS